MSLLLGIIGHPVQHSLSPLLYQAALDQFGLNGSYELFDITKEKLAEGIATLTNSGIYGFNVTLPYKELVMPFMNRLTQEAQSVKAVNTVLIETGKQLTGHNTDVGGFLRVMEQKSFCPAVCPVACVVGSGGAARAAVYGLFKLGISQIIMVARNVNAAHNLVREIMTTVFTKTTLDKLPKIIVSKPDTFSYNSYLNLVINATPIGLEHSSAPNWYCKLFNSMASDGLFLDMVYAYPGYSTLLVKIAQNKGIKAIDGIEMLIEQACLSFEFWTGKMPSAAVLRNALSYASSLQE